jgi:predicted 2-oxoglutarate/Fe(II)-dependent dioxygenase YbiX
MRFYGHAGGEPLAVLFPPPDTAEATRALIDRLGELATVVVARGELEIHPDTRVFIDEQGSISEAYGAVEGAGSIVVLDANLRVLDSFEATEAQPFGPSLAARVLDAISRLPGLEGGRISAQAPVLLVPRVLPPSVCAELMQLWAQENEETGVETSEYETRVNVRRDELKRRRDHVVRDDRAMKRLVSAVGRSVMPEVRRVFSFPATRCEGFKIVRYDAESGGFFRAHRDNLSPATAHRRFALTLNLNEDYEGGELRFAEYGPMTYRPAAGEALVFSCSLLHEVTVVTAGRRFALLSFLFGEQDIRQPAGA